MDFSRIIWLLQKYGNRTIYAYNEEIKSDSESTKCSNYSIDEIKAYKHI